MFSPELLRHRGEIARALRSHKYDVSDEGILIPGMGTIGGVMQSWKNAREHQIHKNLFVTEARNKALAVLIANGTVIPTWYCSLFEGNVTPLATWTGVNFDSNATEFTDYDEATRVEFVDGTIADGSVDNSASRADFTISAGVVDKILYGAALLSNSAKESITGTLLAASLFSSPRTVNATDVLTVQYTLSLTAA